ncbi:MAG TPA: tyrosine--tRNA ligase [Solirubrobacteraceae bacterium]
MDSEVRTEPAPPPEPFASSPSEAPQPSASSPSEAATWLARNAVDSLPEGVLARKLGEGRPLRVKLGIDPTAPDIHLGHTVVLQKLREFQDLGHEVVLIIGDYTARVGDPSGRSATRPVLTGAEIDANARTFTEQAFTVLDPDRTSVRFNGEWLDMSMEELFKLARIPTVSQLLERDDFAKRFASHTPISLLELLYPLLQAYDSVAIRADVELGGTDQKFNLLLGRDIQRAYDVPEQAIVTMPLLPGTDGVQRMAKSLRNYIGVSEPPEQIYGKTLSIPDDALALWYELLLGSGVPPELGPRDAKRALARALVARFHGPEAAQAAEREFDRVHIDRQAPEEIPTVDWPADRPEVHLPALLASAFGISTSEARRALTQGGVKLDGETVGGGSLDVPAADVDGKVLQLGKRRFVRVRVR